MTNVDLIHAFLEGYDYACEVARQRVNEAKGAIPYEPDLERAADARAESVVNTMREKRP